MSWLIKHRDLGVVKENTQHDVFFEWGGLPEELVVTKIESSCGCTKSEYNNETGYLIAVYKAGKIPKHLQSIGEMTTLKKVKLYTNKGDFTLTFKATITR